MAWAIWKRRWILAAANLALICFHATMLEPDFVRDRRFDSSANGAETAAANAPTVRIFFANGRAENTERQAMLDEMKAADPDVIVLVEISHWWYETYRHEPFFAAYPYGGGMRDDGLETVHVFSRIPLNHDWREGNG